jgi:hypothetical protein
MPNASDPSSPHFEFTLEGARDAATTGRIDEWVDAFLTWSRPGANPYMAAGLGKQRRWWLGPLEVRLGSLNRICGPEPEMPYRTQIGWWEDKVSAIALSSPNGFRSLSCSTRERGGLHDGNHRHEAMRRRERLAFIWCNTESDYALARATYGECVNDDD